MSATMGESAFAGGTLGRGGFSCYPAPWSKALRNGSVSLWSLLLAYALVMLLWVVPSAGAAVHFGVAVVLGILAAGLLSLVRGYEVTDVEIVVRRLGWPEPVSHRGIG